MLKLRIGFADSQVEIVEQMKTSATPQRTRSSYRMLGKAAGRDRLWGVDVLTRRNEKQPR
jgi:hypothetical protein